MAVTSFISAQNAQQRIAMEEMNSSPLILLKFQDNNTNSPKDSDR
jgi:hypothetical protein